MNDKLIEYAKKEVMNDEYGRLSLSTRKKLWSEFKIQYKKDPWDVYKTKDFIKKYTLALSCIQKTSYLWNGYNIEASDILKNLITSIGKYLHEFIPEKEFHDICFSAQTIIQDVDSSVIDYMAICYAVLDLANIIMSGESRVEKDYIDDGVNDDELDFNCWDTSYLISLFYWSIQDEDKNIRIEKSREYWLWYIDKFVEIYNSNEFEDLETVK